jgi:branched-chain amino acid transport system substrate-binding protein
MKRIGIGFVTALAVAALILTGCTKKEQAGDGAIKVGIAGPITGPYAKFGEQLVKGMSLLAERVNAEGGIDGRMIEIVQGDDQCDPKQARSVANRMVSDGVHAVVGHFCSSSTIPASEVYAENNLLAVTPASTNPQVTERGLGTVFRTCFRDDQQGNYAGDYIANTLKPKAVAIIHDKDTYGQGLADATRARLKDAHGIEAALYEGVTRGDKDFNSLVTKMKGLNIDMVYFGGLHSEAALIVRQMREQGMNAATFMSGDGIATDEFAQLAGDTALGVLNTFAADPARLDTAREVVEAFRAQNYEPEGFTLYSYAAGEAIIAALKANGASNDGAALAGWMHGNAVSTVLGPVEWDDKGDPKVAPLGIWEWQKGADGNIRSVQIR